MKADEIANQDSTWDKIRHSFNFIPLVAVANAIYDASKHKVG